MTVREILNLIDWLRAQGFDNDKVVEYIETVEGRKKKKKRPNRLTKNKPREGGLATAPLINKDYSIYPGGYPA